MVSLPQALDTHVQGRPSILSLSTATLRRHRRRGLLVLQQLTTRTKANMFAANTNGPVSVPSRL